MLYSTITMWSILATIAVTTEAPANTPWKHASYKTEPRFTPPVLEVENHGNSTPGHIFFAQFGPEATQNAAMIMTQTGRLLWQTDPAATQLVSNLTPAKLHGQDVLLYWEASTSTTSNLPINSHGRICILDDSYQPIYNVTLSDPALSTYGHYNSLIDPHEAFVTTSGTILVLAYDVQPCDLTAVGGPHDGWIRDGSVYEIDISTNSVLFSWRGSRHIPVTESYAALPDMAKAAEGKGQPIQPWDYLHLNSATVFEDGILISSRHTSTVVYIERSTGSVRWTLQGDGEGAFDLEPAARFEWQHDVHIQRSASRRPVLSMFNNRNNGSNPLRETYGLLLELDADVTHHHEVEGISIFHDAGESLTSLAAGSLQMLDSGGVFIGYGTQPVMQEFSKGGTLAQTLRFGPRSPKPFSGVGSYRARKHDWRGYPTTRPKTTGCLRKDGMADVWMSWNGATEVHSWNLYVAGPDGALELAVAGVARDGFETQATVAAGVLIQAEALGGCRNATETRRSEVVLIAQDCVG